MNFSNKKGFTLIELLIVIAIIGILAVAFLPSLLNAPAKGRDAQRLATVQKIQNFLVTQTLAGNALPDTGCVDSTKIAVDKSISKLINEKLSDFGGVFPQDPKDGNEAIGALNTCKDGYGYLNFAAVGKKYSAAVYTAVENADNANVECEDIKDVVDIPLLKDGESIGANMHACYVVLFQ